MRTEHTITDKLQGFRLNINKLVCFPYEGSKKYFGTYRCMHLLE